ncbi:unnamed protein product [Rotaria sordida]|uniref:Neurotransmitter-gated ion-channel ligand-binding domain-containing protein n=1 Tax=Rotaria sordida TaxID=392033 RepID=A0A814VJ98_9BILA|nr:unnamed protein product [Rotaria sordida]
MAQLQRIKICIIILYCLLYSTFGSPDERRLLKHLLIEQQYNKLERPAQNASEPVSVSIGFTLMQIMDFDPKKQVLVTNAWMTLIWQDYSMTWKPQDFGGIATIVLPSTTIWIPDIVLYNSVDEKFNSPTETNVVIQHTGDVLYAPRKIFKSSCSFSTGSIPFDTHSCTLKFGSWTFDSSKINLTFKDEVNDIDVSSYVNNTEWELKGKSCEFRIPNWVFLFQTSCLPFELVGVLLIISQR